MARRRLWAGAFLDRQRGTRIFTAPAGGVEQVIEGEGIISGVHVISFTGTATCTVNGVTKASGDTVELTAPADVTVRFSSGTFSLPQLEQGNIATPFERWPVGTELQLSQRYYQVYTNLADRGHYPNTTAGSATICIALSPAMRTTPSVFVDEVAAALVSSSVIVDQVQPDALTLRSNFLAGASGDYLLRCRASLDAEI
ncbi:hypothetical protein [Algihabitans albus]|uniref:hypothetical protein n=1 Tax=Algihabitans albus TaxID=2164067 RepID=UPI000E5D01C0|nr:hypothetical protein [Algihabitans albus]